MICLDCKGTDIRYDEKEKSYHCNNCGGRYIVKGICKNLNEDCICRIGASSTGFCKSPCSFYDGK